MKYFHQPVLVKEILKYLIIKKVQKEPIIIVDGTVGGGGHSLAIAQKYSILNIKYLIIGIDKDIEAVEAAKKNLKSYQSHIKFINDSFSNYSNILKKVRVLPNNSIDAVLLDLGVSSYQLENPKRGFSFNYPKVKLDMRMNQNQKISAKDIINKYSEKELIRVFQDYGEERFSKRIARNIINHRKKKYIETVGDLIENIKNSIPKKFQFGKTHFATGIFRALRMEVNSELAEIEIAIPQIIESLKPGGSLSEPGGRLAVITFHSIEDRLVKNIFRKFENPCICPPKVPICVCGKKPIIKVLTKKAIKPSPEEILENPRARSAQMRVAEKL